MADIATRIATALNRDGIPPFPANIDGSVPVDATWLGALPPHLCHATVLASELKKEAEKLERRLMAKKKHLNLVEEMIQQSIDQMGLTVPSGYGPMRIDKHWRLFALKQSKRRSSEFFDQLGEVLSRGAHPER